MRFVWVALLLVSPVWGGTPAHWVGQPLSQAIAVLEQQGIAVIYSTDLVKPWMQVSVEPTESEPARLLTQILAPHGLGTRTAPNGELLVVRLTRADDWNPGSTEVADASAQGERPPIVDTILVTANPYQLTRGVAVVADTLTSTDIADLPDLGDDAMRAVARLPGVATNGLSAASHLRGGRTSDALIRFDGLRLYSPFHLRDFHSIFSAIDPSLVRSIDVYTGALPVDAGDRMSGLIDINSLEPPAPSYHEMSLSFFNASALGSGQFDDGRGSWLVAGRRSNLDLWYHAISHEPGTPTYVDGFARAAYRWRPGVELTANALYIADDVTLADEDGEERAAAEFADTYAWLRLDLEPSDSTSGSIWLSRTRLGSHREGSSELTGVSVGSLREDRDYRIDELRGVWRWRAAERWSLEWGGEIAWAKGQHRFADSADLALIVAAAGANPNPHRESDVNLMPAGNRYGLHASARVDPTPRLALNLALRWDRQMLDPTRSQSLSPRIGVEYRLPAGFRLSANWARSFQAQGIDELEVSDGDTEYRRPERTDLIDVGLERRWPGGVALRVELYDKQIADPRPRHENLLNPLTLLPELKPDRMLVAPQSSRARGLEVSLQRRGEGDLRWWLGYSWSSVTDHIDGADVPRSWDQSHALSAGLKWTLRRWDLAAAATLRSGWPASRVEFDTTGAIPRLVVAARNGGRLGNFASVDLRVNRRFDLERSSLSVFLEANNVFSRANRCCTAYDIDDETGAIDLERRNYLPTIPSLGLLWQF